MSALQASFELVALICEVILWADLRAIEILFDGSPAILPNITLLFVHDGKQ